MQVDVKTNVTKIVKDRAFDLVGAGLIIAVGMICLGAVELRNITLREALNILAEALPFYLATVCLCTNYYQKGVQYGKMTDGFKNIVTFYSDKINNLTSKQLQVMPTFCEQYNDKALRQLQEPILKSVAITFEEFNENHSVDGKIIRALKTWSAEALKETYGEFTAKHIIKARSQKIHGINSNILMSSFSNKDMTDIGVSEAQLLKRRTGMFAAMNAVSTVVLTLLSVKSFIDWGWAGAVLVVFKLLYILCRSYMKYYSGYNDITIRVSNHISRKCDILKEFAQWFEESSDCVHNNEET